MRPGFSKLRDRSGHQDLFQCLEVDRFQRESRRGERGHPPAASGVVFQNAGRRPTGFHSSEGTYHLRKNRWHDAYRRKPVIVRL